jgi:hypothetical protein
MTGPQNSAPIAAPSLTSEAVSPPDRLTPTPIALTPPQQPAEPIPTTVSLPLAPPIAAQESLKIGPAELSPASPEPAPRLRIRLCRVPELALGETLITVQEGESLGEIAIRHFSSASAWTAIHARNSACLDTRALAAAAAADLVFPGDQLALPVIAAPLD